jgi:hypothetical protein
MNVRNTGLEGLHAMKTTTAQKRPVAMATASRAAAAIAICGGSPWYGANAKHVVTDVFVDHLRARWLEESSQ